MAELSGVEILQTELEKSKSKLKSYNENIKKLTGFDNPGPRSRFMFGSDRQEPNEGFSGRIGRGRGRLFGLAKRGLMEDNGPPVKRRVVGGAFSRLGPAPVQRRVREESPEEEDHESRRSVHSSVVSTSRDAKNRQDIMQEQTKDKEGMQRNRRMFGLLMGTLNKFKTDSKTMESKAEQRKRIDQKLEENAEKEKKKFKQDTMQLMEERHMEQSRISRLEQKMEVVEEHAVIEREMKKLKGFLCTKTKPRIFWLPKQMNTAAEQKLKSTAKVIDDMLKVSKGRLEKEIKDVMEREQKREERIKSRLKEEGLFLEEGEGKEKEGSRGDDQTKDLDDLSEHIKKEVEDEESMERNASKATKNKRRIVIEDRSGEDSDVAENEPGRQVIEAEVPKKEVEENKTEKKKERKNSKDSSDDSSSDSENESGAEDGGKSKKGKTEVVAQIRKRTVDDDADGSEKEEEEENVRTVLQSEPQPTNTRETEKTEKKDKKRGSDSEKREHKSHGEKHKHSHRRSKHSRKDSEDRTEEKKRSKKSKSSERVVVEDNTSEGYDKDKSSNERKTPVNLIEDVDIDLESEHNTSV